jgi:multidrug resistance protein, MATE family
MSLAQEGFGLDFARTRPNTPRALEEGQSLLRLAAPIMLIALVNMGMSLTDTAMVAALFGTGAMAAVAVGSDLYSIVFYLAAGVLGGFAPFYAGAVARKDGHERARLERLGWLTVALLAFAAVPAVWLAPIWLEPLGIEAGLLDHGSGYTRAMALTLIPMLGVVLYRTLLTAAEMPRVFLRVTLMMLPLNAGMNYILMLGIGPVPAFGPTGAGLSSLIVATASLSLLVAIARRAARQDVALHIGKLDWAGLVAVLRVGLPIGIATVAEVGVFLGATLYAATLGAADVAAHTLVLRIAGVAYAVPTALLQASLVRMARAESIGDTGAARAVTRSSILLSLVFGVTTCLLIVGGASPLVAVAFDATPAGQAAAALAFGLLFLLGVTELVGNPGLAAAGLLRGHKDTRVPMIYVLVGNWGVGAPLGLALCQFGGLGITGVWTGLAAGTLVTTVLTLARLRRHSPAWRIEQPDR